jgi:3-deoxy-D-manno-octulosonic-acid transferase
MTPTGRAAGRQLFGNRVLQYYLPYDFPFAVQHFLEHFRPQIGLLMETEIWFNLVSECRKADLPLLLVNARMSEKSARMYGWFATLSRASLQSLSAVAAQTKTDAERLQRLGAPEVQITGNLKFDMQVPQSAVDLGKALRQSFGETRPVFLAASTREGEETLILQALNNIGIPGLLTVIVPRHPQRFDTVADLLEQRDLNFQRRSGNQPDAAKTRVLLGDSMGEMFAYYAACDIAFIGGSLLPLGGQNLIEAAAVGKPILVGPHTFNFAEATEHAVQAGAALRVADAGELAKTLGDLFKSPERIQTMSAAALAFSDSHRGAAERLMKLIQPYLER